MIKEDKIAALREDYKKATLRMEDVVDNPFEQFDHWFQEALNSKVPEPNAMTLATATKEGRPSARIVLLKGFSESGFKFYSNYLSHKGRELDANPYAGLVFSWLDLQRQIRIEGRVEKLSREDSAAYFKVRPKKSQIGAWVSNQSSIIAERKILEQEFEKLHNKYENDEQLPLPPNWGGYLVIPHTFEFWQGRRSRLHDRIQYKLEDGVWKKHRLAP